MAESGDWHRYTDLLHDARLGHVEWEPAIGQLSLYFHCLRRSSDGRPIIADPVVEFKLAGVAVMVAGYESGLLPAPRPSVYELRRRITREDLKGWPFQAQEAYLAVNSRVLVDQAIHSCICDGLLGTPDELDTCRFRIGLRFERNGIFGMPTNIVTLVIGCDDFETLSSGVPLDVETWSEQFAAWWQGWKQHWDGKANDEVSAPSPEDTFIPAGESPPPALTYRPPQEPAVHWQATDVPMELLEPLTEWFEGRMHPDWLRVAEVEPNLDYATEEWAAKMADRTRYDFDRWVYARQIDEWWVEGIHAQVAVRGVEHTMPDEGRPASNEETVWTFMLREREGRWTIRTYSQGWPPYGSASTKPSSEKPWLACWRSGSIKTQRDQ